MKQSTIAGKPLMWDDGSNVHAVTEVGRAQSLQYTLCGRDVPNGMAYTRDDGENDVTCLKCLQAMGAALP